jgi:hypothetical protein
MPVSPKIRRGRLTASHPVSGSSAITTRSPVQFCGPTTRSFFSLRSILTNSQRNGCCRRLSMPLQWILGWPVIISDRLIPAIPVRPSVTRATDGLHRTHFGIPRVSAQSTGPGLKLGSSNFCSIRLNLPTAPICPIWAGSAAA